MPPHQGETDDSVGVVIGRDDHGHLTAEPDLRPALGILQSDPEVLLSLWDVVVQNVHRYLQLTVAGGEAQLAVAGPEEGEREGSQDAPCCYCCI